MTATEILKLIDAGFTKDEILGLESAQVVPTKAPEELVKEVNEPAPVVPALVPDPQPTNQTSGVTLSDDQFKTLLQQLNVQGASLDVPPESDIKSKLADHFKEVTIGG